MAHLHKKVKKGRPYYYIREIQRVNGKPKVVSQIYLGSAESIAKKFQDERKSQSPTKVKTEEFGSVFIGYLLEKELDTIGIIDNIIKRKPREKGPTVGEYFFYAWLNRLVAPRSKRALTDWYNKTAIQHIRPTDLDLLDSAHYWEKWDGISAQDIEKISKAFFEKVWSMQTVPPECVLFDTTNYYTYMASDTESLLCQRAKNKDNKHHLRQVGLALLVDRKTQIPLYQHIYEGNQHDSKVFNAIIDEMFGTMCDFNTTKQRLTVVFDKGMNGDDNINFIDDHNQIHFITTYSPYFVEDLASKDIKHFMPIQTRKNVELVEADKADDQTTAYRTKLTLWGKERTVVITHNPASARKKDYTLDNKLETLRESLLTFRRNYRESKPHWRKPDDIVRRYERLSENLHIGSQYYQLEFSDQPTPEMTFKKNIHQIQKSKACFGRNVIVTDNHDWTTDDIVQLTLDRYYVEKQFRASKDHRHISMKPFYHWTDSKIRCHLLCCVMALTVMRLLELRIENAKIETSLGSSSGPAIIEEMRNLDAVLLWHPGKRKAERILEDPTKTQIEVLQAFGWTIEQGGVLQKLGD